FQGARSDISRDKPRESEARGLCAGVGARRGEHGDQTRRARELVRARAKRWAQEQSLGAAYENGVVASGDTWAQLSQAGQGSHDVNATVIEARIRETDVLRVDDADTRTRRTVC